MCLLLRAHPSTVPILGSQPAKYTSSLPKELPILLNMEEPPRVWTGVRLDTRSSSAAEAVTEDASFKVRASTSAAHRDGANSPALPLSFLSVTCPLYYFFLQR